MRFEDSQVTMVEVVIRLALAAGAPARSELLLRSTSKHCGQRPLGLVDPRAQELPVPPGRQRLVLGVHGGDQLLEQAVDLSGPAPSPVVGGAPDQ